jgi:FkbM family methyltransferase
MNMTAFTLRRLSFGALVVEGDCNEPVRAEAKGHLDVDGDMPKVCAAIGLKPGDVVVDVGAFVGDTAMSFIEAGAMVFAFEPFLDAYVCLLYNTHGSRRVWTYNSPVGNGEFVKFVYECPGPNYGMRRVVPVPQNDPDAVVTVRLDDISFPRVKLIKIDCEGSEIPTLLGAKRLIRDDRPYLFVEMYEEGLKQRGYTPADLEATIRDLGYDLQMWGEPPRWDWLCIPH